ncbi:MAG: DUF2188 domain-containing protein [Clostridia bacterium]|nr:DUF2188 domain-containing protein [Clostridia bacterium]
MITALLSSWSDFWDDAGEYLTREWGGLTYWMWFTIAILVVVAVILIAVFAAKGSKKRKLAEEDVAQAEEEFVPEETQPEPEEIPYVYDSVPAYEAEPEPEPETVPEPVYEQEPEYEPEPAYEPEPKPVEDERSWYTSYVDESISGEEEVPADEYVPPVEEKPASVEEDASVRVYVQTEYEQKPVVERTRETYYETPRVTEKVYHVSKRRLDGKWQVKASKSTKVIRLFDKYRDAIEYAKKLAINQGTRVIIHKADGTFSKISFDSRQ